MDNSGEREERDEKEDLNKSGEEEKQEKKIS